jgi:hypothetical protein
MSSRSRLGARPPLARRSRCVHIACVILRDQELTSESGPAALLAGEGRLFEGAVGAGDQAEVLAAAGRAEVLFHHPLSLLDFFMAHSPSIGDYCRIGERQSWSRTIFPLPIP